jgi:hypothetical protein
MATCYTEDLWTHEVRRPPQWISESLTVWFWVQQDINSRQCKVLFSTFSVAEPIQTGGSDLEEVRCGCRLAPMDCQGVREVVNAHHCPGNDIN